MIVNAFTCTGAYAVLIMSGLKRVENRSMMPVPARGRCSMSVSKSFRRVYFAERMADDLRETHKSVEIEVMHTARPFWRTMPKEVL